jgi:hypothetical protein
MPLCRRGGQVDLLGGRARACSPRPATSAGRRWLASFWANAEVPRPPASEGLRVVLRRTGRERSRAALPVQSWVGKRSQATRWSPAAPLVVVRAQLDVDDDHVLVVDAALAAGEWQDFERISTGGPAGRRRRETRDWRTAGQVGGTRARPCIAHRLGALGGELNVVSLPDAGARTSAKSQFADR